jgi:hypothetical protein
MTRPGRLTRLLAIGIGLGIAVGIAHARKEQPPPGNLAWVKDGAIWRASLAAPERAEKLVDFRIASALVRALTAAADGSALLVDLGSNAAWIDLDGGKAGPPIFLPCSGGHLAADGGRVLCAARRGKGAVAYRMRPRLGTAALEALSAERTALTGGDHMISEKDGGLRDGDHVLAPHVPLDHLSVSPDGGRAVGRYPDGDGDALFGFRLDGRAARRKLITGTPVAWSADSAWLAVDGEDTACVLRAVGGEYKCWDHFRALAVSRDGSLALLAGGGDVYLVPTAGPRASKPRLLVAASPAATLLP